MLVLIPIFKLLECQSWKISLQVLRLALAARKLGVKGQLTFAHFFLILGFDVL